MRAAGVSSTCRHRLLREMTDMPKKSIDPSWLTTLTQHVESKPCVLLRLDESDSASLIESRRGFNEFTLARPHELLSNIETPTACLIFSSPPDWKRTKDTNPTAYLGIVSSRSAITTLDTRIKIKRAARIEPGTESGLVSLLGTGPQATLLRKKLEPTTPVVVLSPKLSSAARFVHSFTSSRANRFIEKTSNSASPSVGCRSFVRFREFSPSIPPLSSRPLTILIGSL